MFSWHFCHKCARTLFLQIVFLFCHKSEWTSETSCRPQTWMVPNMHFAQMCTDTICLTLGAMSCHDVIAWRIASIIFLPFSPKGFSGDATITGFSVRPVWMLSKIRSLSVLCLILVKYTHLFHIVFPENITMSKHCCLLKQTCNLTSLSNGRWENCLAGFLFIHFQKSI